jgi:glycosyltransferase involved in cell wall biosynthesis
MNRIRPKFTLGVVAGDVAARDKNGRLMVTLAIGRLLQEIRIRIPDTRICLPLSRELKPATDYELGFPDDAVAELPPLESTLQAQHYYMQTRRAVQRFAKTVDVLLMRLPFQLPMCLLGLNKPKLLQVATNPYEVARVSSDYEGIMKILARGYARISMSTMRRLVGENHTAVVSHGEEMWNLLDCARGRVVVSSSLYKREMQPRATFELANPPRLLFVGYLRPDKGLDSLLAAFTMIRKHRHVKLTLVCGKDRKTKAEASIKRIIEQNPYKEDIEQKGMIGFGEELFDLYRSHDIYVLPSLAEGTPRTLIEARSLGCPVVATAVGGVPSSIRHGEDGLLVRAGDAEGMASAILRILDDEGLRLRLIHEGLRRTQSCTLERFADEITDELQLLHDAFANSKLNQLTT